MVELRVKQIIWVPPFNGPEGAIHGVGEDGRVYWYQSGVWAPMSTRLDPANEERVQPTPFPGD